MPPLAFIPTRLRIISAACLVAVSFAAERFIYHGWCVIPSDGEFLRFFAFPALFVVGFIWLTAEVLGRMLSFVPLPGLVTWPIYVLAALVLYVAVAGAFWQANPTPIDAQTADRALLSFFWSAGILVETGNFSDVSCGY